ncbi:hypothetical protein ACTFIU_010601 [Dictyostelium citrinum]
MGEIIFDSLEFSKFNEKSTPVHTISFCRELNKEILENLWKIPDSIKAMVLIYDIFDRIFPPSSITSIQFGKMYNKPIKIAVLPSSLTSLEFGDSFNQSLRGYWLPSDVSYDQSDLRILKLGEDFNQSIEDQVIVNQYSIQQFKTIGTLKDISFNYINSEVLKNGSIPSLNVGGIIFNI